MKQLFICGHAGAIIELENNPINRNVLCLYSPMPIHYEGMCDNLKRIGALAKHSLMQAYYDIDTIMDGWREPRLTDVEHALEFARDKDELMVCCHAGVSRSSANAYVIAAEEVGPEAALGVLLPHHNPNSLIIEHGAKILGKPEIVRLVNTWKRTVRSFAHISRLG